MNVKEERTKRKAQERSDEVTEEQFMKALVELNGKAGSNAIRSKLGVAPSQVFNAKLRVVAKSLEKAGKIKVGTVEGKRTWVYEAL